jgi:hypothetical protein
LVYERYTLAALNHMRCSDQMSVLVNEKASALAAAASPFGLHAQDSRPGVFLTLRSRQ